MISCRDAQHLFDRYLDGELPASLQTELHAHRLNCTSCQNELAMAESFGDVIALDRCEPALSASFTDRLLLANRTQMRPRRRQWSRMFVLGGSPVAAAASIALVFAVISPPRPQVAGVAALRNNPAALIPVTELATAQPAAPVTPAAGFIEGLLAPLVEQSRTTLEGTRRSAQELAYLLHVGLTDTNQMLVAHWETAQRSVFDGPAPGIYGEDTDPLLPFPSEPDQRSEEAPARARTLQPL